MQKMLGFKQLSSSDCAAADELRMYQHRIAAGGTHNCINTEYERLVNHLLGVVEVHCKVICSLPNVLPYLGCACCSALGADAAEAAALAGLLLAVARPAAAFCRKVWQSTQGHTAERNYHVATFCR
jgi:hypothetical protein